MIPKRKLTLDEVSLEIDLEKLFGKQVTSSAIRETIAGSLIDIIIERTESGRGVDGNGKEIKLKSPYSKEYADSLEFQAFGKSRNEVNMKLTGNMLDSIDVVDQSPKKLKIGIANDQAAKAYNHMVGDTVPKRPFLGLTQADLDKIKEEFSDAIEVGERVTVRDIFDRNAQLRILDILRDRNLLEFSDED